ncbi:MAG: hypothetical protein IJ693_01665 [Bacteroidaceae bacterium]|nr:hypothetical protein [Bacteroidaceae bacterium]
MDASLLQDGANDSLILNVLKTDSDRAFSLVDSLEASGEFSADRSNYYRARIYYMMGKEADAESYCEKVIESGEMMNERPELLYHSYDLRSTILIHLKNVEKALSNAQDGFDIVSKDPSELGQHWRAVLLHLMGYCQMELGRIDEAESCFSQAYIALKQMADANRNYKTLSTWARVTINIVDAYTATGQYDKAAVWMASAKEAIHQFCSSPECPEDVAMSYRQGLSLHQAIVLLHQGKREEADLLYDQVVAAGYADTNFGLLECADYLEKAERWDDLEALKPRLDLLNKERSDKQEN